MKNLVRALFEHQEIRTTLPKAKAAQGVAEKLITIGKKNTLHARRHAFQILQDRAISTKLFREIAPRFEKRAGGYTRVLHMGVRPGDAAPMALLELTEKEVIEKKIPEKKAKAKKPETSKETKVSEDKPEVEKSETPKFEKKPSKPQTKEMPSKKGFFGNVRKFFGGKGKGA